MVQGFRVQEVSRGLGCCLRSWVCKLVVLSGLVGFVVIYNMVLLGLQEEISS